MTSALTAGPGVAGNEGDGAVGLSTDLPEHAIRVAIARVAVARHTRFITRLPCVTRTPCVGNVFPNSPAERAPLGCVVEMEQGECHSSRSRRSRGKSSND